jgi:hypothetical protein
MSYYLRDRDAGITRDLDCDYDEAVVAANDWARDGDYGEIESTIWVDTELWERATCIVSAYLRNGRPVFFGSQADLNEYLADGDNEPLMPAFRADVTKDVRELTRSPYPHGIDLYGDLADDKHIDTITTAIDPDAPDCDDPRGHNWKAPHELVGGIEDNPGVWGSGGGVKIHEVCVRCGCGKLTDTWAQRPDTGEQGLDSVAYTKDEYTEQIEEAVRATRIGDCWNYTLVDDIAHGDGSITTVGLAEGPYGRWASWNQRGDEEADVEWHRSEESAREQAQADVDNLRKWAAIGS